MDNGPVAPLGLEIVGPRFSIHLSSLLGLCESGKMPDLRRGDLVGFHDSRFNPTYVL